MNSELLTAIRAAFFRSATQYAMAKVEKVYELDENDQPIERSALSYFPVEGAPTDQQIEDHLEGLITLGAYTLNDDATVNWGCWDVDCGDDFDRGRNITEELSEMLEGIPHWIEFSGGKGYHVWVFFQKPENAEKVRELGIGIREVMGVPATGKVHMEFFPKQGTLDLNSPMGNLVKLPCGLHPKTKNRSMFIDRRKSWENGQALDLLTVLEGKTTLAQLQKIVIEADPINQIIRLLEPFFSEGTRHDLILSLAGFLGNQGWAQDDVEAVVLALIELRGGEEDNLIECVQDTYQKIAEGKTVIGYTGISERLPVAVMRKLAEAAGQKIANAEVQLADRIRMDKGQPTFLKVRSVANLIVQYLHDKGRLVKADGTGTVYWLDNDTHKLINTEQIGWQALINRRFGINPRESFGAQVVREVDLKSWDFARKATVHKRFYWDKNTVYINFGGAEVYQLNGVKGERVLSYNGDNDLLFETSEQATEEYFHGRNVFEAEPLDPWQFLTDDLNFVASDSTAATNDQQRQMLRAWILQMFFGNMLNTRPIALFLGPRGSGKTTAARRVLRFIEGFQQDVLGIAEDKPDSLRSSLEGHTVLAIDNLEQVKVRWLDNFLNRLSTGAQIELRKLHQTNAKYTIKPDVFVLLTGIEVPTNQESLYSRLLPFNMDSLTKPKPEHLMQSRLQDNYIGVWAGMFDIIDSVITELKLNRQTETPTTSRLADFFVFCDRIKNAKGLNGPVLMDGLRSLVDSQVEVMGNNSAAIAALDMWLEQCSKSKLALDKDLNKNTFRSSGEMFQILSRVARENRIPDFIWTKPTGFGRHFSLLAKTLERSHGLITKAARDSRQGKDIVQYSFQNYGSQNGHD